MTDIEAKALALVNEVHEERISGLDKKINYEGILDEALCRAIEQHEATKQERDNLTAALKATAATCADHVNTILQLRSELADFKQEVSSAAEKAVEIIDHWSGDRDGSDFLQRFIIPKPKPDPLAQVLEDIGWGSDEEEVGNLRAALEARGLEIRSKNDDQ